MRTVSFFLLIVFNLAGLPCFAQTGPPATFPSAKDYIREREKTDPNMHRFPDDRRIKLDSNLIHLDSIRANNNGQPTTVKKAKTPKKTFSKKRRK